ncbi:LGFP repeat-containing protein [Cytobacillus firmus]|uniref:LGFP repeat-containing protein n=1 Tax=Cytobacillus firmus TaxID=1399 RepID=UPI001C8E1417|nr:hypothetical protein [Cytobacillus firmus]MBX9974279.1 hypothetical protein [Cytobacillus firmus]
MPQHLVEPVSIIKSVRPGDTILKTFTVKTVPQGTLVATITGESSSIRLQHFSAYKVERRWYSDEELLDLPAAIRERAREEGYPEYIEVARAGDGEPLQVSHGNTVQGIIEFNAPYSAIPMTESATLVIEGWSSGTRVEIPIQFIIGDILVEFLVSPIIAHRGQEVEFPVRVSMPISFPSTELTLAATGPWIDIPPQRIYVPSGGSATTTLKLRLNSGAPLGPLNVKLEVNGLFGSNSEYREFPFLLDVKQFSYQMLATEKIQAKAALLNQGPPGPRFPISGVEEAGDGGFVQRFSTGNIYWHKETGANWVYGAILQKYTSLGGPNSLGYPITDELPTPNQLGRFNDFQKGSVYFSSQGGANVIRGKIREYWLGLGGESSYLGFPTYDQRDKLSRFERGTIQLQNTFVFDVADAREYKSGVIHVDGAAANGWNELMVSSTGGYKFKGSMRATGLVSYDVLMAVSIDLRPFGGPVIVFAEEGDVEGTLVLGGNRAHTWDTIDMDSRIKDNWQFMRKAGISSSFTVEFGPGDLLAIIASIIGVPVGIIILIASGAHVSSTRKACPWYGHEFHDRELNQWTQEKGVRWIPKDQPCPEENGTLGP